MKKILLDIHIYLSLLCAGYMIIYGVSGIAFNHDVHPSERDGVEWEAVVEVPDADALDLGKGAGKEWTVTIWFKGDITRSGWLLRKGGSGGSHTTDYGVLASSSYRTFVWGTGRFSAAGGNDTTDWMVVPTSNIGTDEWHHVVATYKQGASNAGFKNFYIDGQQIGRAGSGTRKNPTNNGLLLIGSEINRSFWQGHLDDIRIYNRALSKEQVKALYEFEKPKK